MMMMMMMKNILIVGRIHLKALPTELTDWVSKKKFTETDDLMVISDKKSVKSYQCIKMFFRSYKKLTIDTEPCGYTQIIFLKYQSLCKNTKNYTTSIMTDSQWNIIQCTNSRRKAQLDQACCRKIRTDSTLWIKYLTRGMKILSDFNFLSQLSVSIVMLY